MRFPLSEQPTDDLHYSVLCCRILAERAESPEEKWWWPALMSRTLEELRRRYLPAAEPGAEEER